MSKVDRTYCTAADFARETGYDRTTIAKWIKAGKLRGFKRRNKRGHHRIPFKYLTPRYIDKNKKANPRSDKSWSDVELYQLRINIDKDLDTLCILLQGRSRNAIKVKRCRIKR